MLSIWTVGTIVGCYLLALFALAFWGDKRLRDNRQHPILYSLGLGVHCTSWAFSALPLKQHNMAGQLSLLI